MIINIILTYSNNILVRVIFTHVISETHVFLIYHFFTPWSFVTTIFSGNIDVVRQFYLRCDILDVYAINSGMVISKGQSWRERYRKRGFGTNCFPQLACSKFRTVSVRSHALRFDRLNFSNHVQQWCITRSLRMARFENSCSPRIPCDPLIFFLFVCGTF